MSNLTLPFSATGNTSTLGSGGTAFAITLTGGGGCAISAESFGTDGQGDTPIGVYAETDVGTAVVALATGVGAEGYATAVEGQASAGIGVAGNNGVSPLPVDRAAGVVGSSENNYGVFGTSGGYDGVKGVSGASDHAGVSAVNDAGGYGVWARGTPAVFGSSDTSDAINGTSASPQHAGVSANNTSSQSGQIPSGFALWASSNNTGVFARGNPAGYFDGDIQVTGDVVLINSASGDVAEDFDVEDAAIDVEPGTVLVIGPLGRLRPCSAAYDPCAAGVVSGAGRLKPAVVLQRIKAAHRRSPIALVGKVYCKVDADFGAISPGDLLTTATRECPVPC